jgi:AcrR family transcriptional regulator
VRPLQLEKSTTCGYHQTHSTNMESVVKQTATTAAEPARRRDRAAREQSLILAATKLFAGHGYEATTTREVAGRAGCSEGLIHRYFKGKEGLLLAVMNSHISRRVVELTEHLPFSASLEEEIRQLMSWEVDRMWEDRDFFASRAACHA